MTDSDGQVEYKRGPTTLTITTFSTMTLSITTLDLSVTIKPLMLSVVEPFTELIMNLKRSREQATEHLKSRDLYYNL